MKYHENVRDAIERVFATSYYSVPLPNAIVTSLNDAKIYHGNYVIKQESVNSGTAPLRAEGFRSSV